MIRFWLERFAQRASAFLVDRSRQQYSQPQIVWSVIGGASLELIVVPALLISLGRLIDRALGLSPLVPPAWVPWLAACCFAIGVPWLAWSILWHHRRGRGTPLPLVPTKELLADGPYRYMRNPMNFGAIFWLAGWGVLANSPTGLLGGVGFFAGLVLSYIKLIEERELALRFGQAYLDYKRCTPFLVPRCPRAKESPGSRPSSL